MLLSGRSFSACAADGAAAVAVPLPPTVPKATPCPHSSPRAMGQDIPQKLASLMNWWLNPALFFFIIIIWVLHRALYFSTLNEFYADESGPPAVPKRGRHLHKGCRRHSSVTRRWMCHKTPRRGLGGHSIIDSPELSLSPPGSPWDVQNRSRQRPGDKMGHREQSCLGAGASFPYQEAKAKFPITGLASTSPVGPGDGDQSPSSCPGSTLRALRIHRSRLAPLITALMVPTRLLFLSRTDRGRQCEAFIFGTPGYL